MKEFILYNSSIDPSNPWYFFPIITSLLILLVLINGFVYLYNKNNQPDICSHNTSNSDISNESESLSKAKNSLRFRYLLAYLFTRASVWSKSPYLYTMYNKYHGFSIDEIGILYVIDAVTALISGPLLGNLADKYGRKLFCINYCILVISNLSLRVTGSKPLAYLAQVLTGLGAGLIMTTFESWVNYEANKVFGSKQTEKERFLKKLFKTQSLFDALTSLCVSSVTAFLFAKYGILFPICMSIFFACMAMVIICCFWDENKPNSSSESSMKDSLKEAFKELRKREVLCIGVMESLYNAVVNIFIFSWTPLLQRSTNVDNLQVGFVFICFVCSVIIGTSLFEFFIITLKTQFYLTMCVILFADMSLFMSVYCNDSFIMRLISLASIEGFTGFYLPLNSIVKSKILVEKHRATLMSIFRIPLNIYVIFVLVSLKFMDPFSICLIACGMITLAFLIGLSLYFYPPERISTRKYSEYNYAFLETKDN